MSELNATSNPPESTGSRRPVGLIVVVACFVVFLAVSLLTKQQDDGNTAKRIGIILAAGLTLTMYSFLFGDNVFFKMAENLYVGVALGYGMVLSWYQVFKPELYDPLFRAAVFV